MDFLKLLVLLRVLVVLAPQVMYQISSMAQQMGALEVQAPAAAEKQMGHCPIRLRCFHCQNQPPLSLFHCQYVGGGTDLSVGYFEVARARLASVASLELQKHCCSNPLIFDFPMKTSESPP